ncbi:MAG: hypothetical protein MUF51_06700 [Vicinamibacteria bacterium]|jgi:hypothetical protein|nr:hypothetical protein [Vicinamibacteria bacterium]
MILRWTLAITLVLLVGVAITATASLPVEHKSEGCVINATAYSKYNATTVYKFTFPKDFDLKPYEGKKVLLEGWLSPGDSFTPKGKTLKILGQCDAATRKLIAKS